MLLKRQPQWMAENWRPIVVLPITYKVLATTLLIMLEKKFDERTDGEQIGGQKGFSVLDGLVLLQKLLEQI